MVQFYEFLYEETKQWRLKVVDLILLRLGKLKYSVLKKPIEK